MRLIDADALRLMKVEECEGHSIEYAMGWKACLEYINATPAIDAVPVVHGRWIEDNYGYFHCSECGFEWDESEVTSKYCPDCGAKMDGGDDGARMD